jgi:hypothetical protein
MSEKIYVCLLRLFPSAFRKQYEEEALRLLRDRLSEERGFFSRLRLCFDLLEDMISALPQAYRNSYAEVAPAASLTNHFDAVPLFRVLQKEPLQRGAVVLGSVLSLTTLAIFTYVLNRPVLHRAPGRNEPMSPIEFVIEHLNRPISPDSASGIRPDILESASAERAPTETQFATADAALAASGQPLVQSQPQAIRNASQGANPSNTQDRMPAAIVANLSGIWTGSFRTASGGTDVPQLFILQQEGAKLTGTGGPDSTEQYSIINGSVAADSAQFEMNMGQSRFLYDLKVENNALRGFVSISGTNQMHAAKVWLMRSHE